MYNSENPILLIDFLNYLKNIKNYSITTIREYTIDLMFFFRFIKNYCNIEIAIKDFNIFIFTNLKESDIIAFLVYLNYTKDDSASTRKRKLCSIKAFYKWLFNFNPTGNIKNPALDLPSIKYIKTLPKYLSLEKVKKIINVFNFENSKFPIRNNTIIELFLNCGLRASELININLCDINLSDSYIRIFGKGHKERICFLNNNIKNKLMEYINIRTGGKNIINIYEPLFLSYRKDRLNLRTVEKIVKDAYKLAKLEDRGYTTHTLRHTTATLIYEYFKSDILLLKEILGHSTVKSTEIYTHVHNSKIKEAFNSNPLSDFNYKNVA